MGMVSQIFQTNPEGPAIFVDSEPKSIYQLFCMFTRITPGFWPIHLKLRDPNCWCIVFQRVCGIANMRHAGLQRPPWLSNMMPQWWLLADGPEMEHLSSPLYSMCQRIFMDFPSSHPFPGGVLEDSTPMVIPKDFQVILTWITTIWLWLNVFYPPKFAWAHWCTISFRYTKIHRDWDITISLHGRYGR